MRDNSDRKCRNYKKAFVFRNDALEFEIYKIWFHTWYQQKTRRYLKMLRSIMMSKEAYIKRISFKSYVDNIIYTVKNTYKTMSNNAHQLYHNREFLIEGRYSY